MNIVGDSIAGVLVGTSTYIAWTSSRSISDPLVGDAPASVKVCSRLVLIWASIVLWAFVLEITRTLGTWSLHVSVAFSWAVAAVLASRLFGSRVDHRKRRPEGEPREPDWRRSQRFFPNLVIAAAFGIAAAHSLLFGILQVPSDWDTLAYHLPIIDHWIQEQTLASQRCGFWYVPGNSELLGYWLACPFSGNFWVQLSNLPALILLGFAALGIAQQLGLSPRVASLAVFGLIVAMPMLRQVASVENEIALSALFLAGVLFTCRWDQSGNRFDLGIAIIASGLLAGIKYYALAYSGVLFACISLVTVRRNGIRGSAIIGVIWFASTLCLAGYWYVRNLIIAGSPLYPKGVAILGLDGPWDSLRPDLHMTSLLFGMTPEVGLLLTRAWLVQTGPWMASAMLLTIPVLLSCIWREIRCQETGDLNLLRGHLVFVCALVGAGFCYTITPNAIETQVGTQNMIRLQYPTVRFGYCSATMMCLLITRWLFDVNSPFGRTGRDQWFLLLGCASAWALGPQLGLRKLYLSQGVSVWRDSGLDYPWWIWAITIIGISSMFFRVLHSHVLQRRSASVLLAMFAFASPILSTRWHERFEQAYEDQLRGWYGGSYPMVQPGDIVLVGDYRYYASIGSRRQFAAVRPSWTIDHADFKAYVDLMQPDWIVVPHADTHWSKSYAPLKRWMTTLRTSYEHTGRTGGFVLYRKRQVVDAPISQDRLE